MEKKKRIEWIDEIKCICILCIMLGHFSFIPNKIATFSSPFCLTAFLFCSGYTFHLEKNFKTYFKKRFFQIIIPMIWMGSVIVLSRLILTFKEHNSILTEIKNFCLQIRGQGDEMWFLALMFGADLVFYLIVQILKDNKKKIFIVTFILLMLSDIYSFTIKNPLPWHIQMYGVASFFMSLGYLFNGTAEKIFDKYNSIYLFIISFIMFLMLWLIFIIFLNHKAVTFYSFGDNLLYYFAQILSSLIMLISATKLLRGNKIVLYIGQNTLVLYGLHGKLESVYEVILKKTIGESNVITELILGILGVIIITAILLIVSYIMNKYLPFLVGKKRKAEKING